MASDKSIYPITKATLNVVERNQGEQFLPAIVEEVKRTIPQATESAVVHALHVIKDWGYVELDTSFDYNGGELVMLVYRKEKDADPYRGE